MRIIIFWDLYWGLLILENYHIDLSEKGLQWRSWKHREERVGPWAEHSVAVCPNTPNNAGPRLDARLRKKLHPNDVLLTHATALNSKAVSPNCLTEMYDVQAAHRSKAVQRKPLSTHSLLVTDALYQHTSYPLWDLSTLPFHGESIWSKTFARRSRVLAQGL